MQGTANDLALWYSALMTVVSGVMLILAWRVTPSEDAPAYWGAGNLIGALSYAAMWLRLNGVPNTTIVIDALTVINVALFVVGCLRFFGWPLRIMPIVLASIATWMLFVALQAPTLLPIWHTAATNIFVTVALLSFAFIFLWHAWQAGGTYAWPLAILLSLWAVVRLAGLASGQLPNIAMQWTIPVVQWTLPIVRLGVSLLLMLMVQERIVQHLRQEVAERTRAENDALENQRRFEDLVGISSDWVWELDADLRLTYMSQNIIEFSGLPAAFYVGKYIGDVSAATYSESGWNEFIDHLRNRKTLRKLRMMTDHRETNAKQHYELSASPVHDAEGKFSGFRGMGRDITGEVASQSSLEVILGGVANAVGTDYFTALVSHLAATLDVDIALIAAARPRDNKLRTLAVWLDGMPGPNREYDVEGKPSAVVMSGKFCEIPSGVTTQFAGEGWMREQRIESYAGTPLLDSTGKPIGVLALMKREPIGNIETVRTVLKALAPRAAAELQRQIADEQVREAEQRFRSVVDNMPVGVLVKTGTRYSFVNRTFAKWVDLPAAEIESLTEPHLHERLQWVAQERDTILATQRQVRETGKPVMRERIVRLPDGRMRDIFVTTFPIFNTAGDVASLGLVVADVTELRRAETHLQQTQKMEALGRLAGGVAHDFNNIVGAIAGFARFIAEDTAPSSREHQYAERILTASSRAKQLIQQILTFSGRSGTRRQNVSVPTAVEEAITLLRATVASSTHIETDTVLANAMAKADPTQLSQVLINICVNANDALGSRPGRIGISVTRQAGEAAAQDVKQDTQIAEIEAGLRTVVGTFDLQQSYILLQIADNGPGMSREVMERIFEPFFTTKGPGQGTGLGLAVVHGIILGHGGVMAVTSRTGGGTVFDIWLPEATGEMTQQPYEAIASSASIRGRILVIDDDGDFGDMTATSMERLGYEVGVANLPGDALQAVLDDPDMWDLVITDYTMPEMNGLEVIARIKQHRPNLPCILCTGYGRNVTEEQARHAGASAFMSKPLDPTLLGQAVAKLIGRA